MAQLAVDDVSFEVQEGEIFSLLGPNGAGNHNDFHPVDVGLPALATRKFGYSVTNPMDVKRLSASFRRNALYDDMTALENLNLVR